MEKTWLITGGLGYIGSHVAHLLTKNNIPVIILDSLINGNRKFAPTGIPLIEGDINDTNLMLKIASNHNNIIGIIHLAAFKNASLSIQQPLLNYKNNICGTLSMLELINNTDIKYLIFASSAAIYGNCKNKFIKETDLKVPISPYGKSKLICENLIKDYARTNDKFKYVSLRYFNVAGSGCSKIYDKSNHNLIPILIQNILKKENPIIYGHQYDTPDKTCIRDYIHINDLSEVHLNVIKLLYSNKKLHNAYNLGSSIGISVKEIIQHASNALKIQLQPRYLSKRRGDSSKIIANTELAQKDLSFKVHYSIKDIILSAYRSYRTSFS